MLLRGSARDRAKGHEMLSAALGTARQFDLVDQAETIAAELAQRGSVQEFKKTRGRPQASS
jgi:hypothetical protein